MEEQMKSINVEEIMAEIRLNIEKRGDILGHQSLHHISPGTNNPYNLKSFIQS